MGIKTNCDFCGIEFIYKGGKVHFERNEKHYCKVSHIASHGLATRNNKDKRYKLWESISKRAKLKNIEINIKATDIPKIPKYCPILNIEIIQDNNIVSDNSPSIDRIDSNKGYIKGNIQIISNRANRIKSDATPEELIKIGEYMKGIINEKI